MFPLCIYFSDLFDYSYVHFEKFLMVRALIVHLLYCYVHGNCDM